MATTPYEHDISIDLSEQFGIQYDVETKQLDNVTFIVSVNDKGVPYDLTNATIILQAKRSDGTDYIQTNFDIIKNGNKVTIKCTDELTNVSGLCKAEIRIRLNNATTQVTSRYIYLKILPSTIQQVDRTVHESTLTAVGYVYNLVDELATLKTDLTTDIDLANKAIVDTENKIQEGNNKITDINNTILTANTSLTSIKNDADNKILELNSTINNANTIKNTLQNVTSQSIADINNTISNANTSKVNLQNVNDTSNQLKLDLESLNTTSQNSKSNLQSKIDEADQIKLDLQNYDPTNLVQNTNILLNQMNSNQLLLSSFTHTLNCYPFVQIIFAETGFGLGAFGTSLFSANGVSDMIRNKIDYKTLNTFDIYVPTNYYISGTPNITKIDNYKYIVTFSGSSKSIMIQMYKI